MISHSGSKALLNDDFTSSFESAADCAGADKLKGSRELITLTLLAHLATSQNDTHFGALVDRQVANVISSRSSVCFHSQKMSFVSISSRPSTLRFKICCSAKGETQAKKETVDKVCMIVKKQLAVPDGTAVTAESKFSELGADSLDTVEIVMGLEEEFNITVDETSAQDIATVQDAANLIEKLVTEKTA